MDWRVGRRILGFAALSLPPLVYIENNIVSIGRVNGSSMKPALNPETNLLTRDIVLLWRWNIHSRKFKSGEIVAFRSPIDPSKLSIKRITATELEWVKSRKGGEPLQIPRGYVWVKGDEGYHSIDSNEYGPVSTGLIEAHVAWILFPRIQRL